MRVGTRASGVCGASWRTSWGRKRTTNRPPTNQRSPPGHQQDINKTLTSTLARRPPRGVPKRPIPAKRRCA
eukprot:4507434-Pyramimonas_sp.AAC.1